MRDTGREERYSQVLTFQLMGQLLYLQFLTYFSWQHGEEDDQSNICDAEKVGQEWEMDGENQEKFFP